MAADRGQHNLVSYVKDEMCTLGASGKYEYILKALQAMSRDVAVQASAKLSGDWSAPEYTKSLTKEVLQELLPRFPKLDPLVRMRLLLSIMSLPTEARANMQQELQALSAAVKVDKEEWVGIIGRAVGHFDGRLDMDAVLKGSSAVRETLRDLQSRAEKAKTAGMRPLEEMYLSKRLQSAAMGGAEQSTGHSHFQLREGVASASAALAQSATLAQPAANAEDAANLASATAIHAALAPSPPPGGPAGPSHRRPPDGASHSLGKRSGGMGELNMFRSTRPAHVSMKRPAAGGAASAGGYERKGIQRTAKAMLIDVNEAIALQQHSLPQAHSASQATESGERGAAAHGGSAHAQDLEDDMEEGEVAEEGELPMTSTQAAKRHRMHGPPKTLQPYRDRGPYFPPPAFSPQRYQDGHLSPGESRLYGEHTQQRSGYGTYNGGHEHMPWEDLDADQQAPLRGVSGHHRQHQ